MPRKMTIKVATYEECEQWAFNACRTVRCDFCGVVQPILWGEEKINQPLIRPKGGPRRHR